MEEIVDDINKKEVLKSPNSIESRKFASLDGIPVKFLKRGEQIMIKWYSYLRKEEKS